MESNRRERDEDATLVSKPECEARAGHRIAIISSTVTLFENFPIASQPLEATLEKVGASIQRAEGEDTSDSLADRPVPEERPALSTWSTQSGSSAA